MNTAIVHSSPPHIPPKLPFKTTSSRPVHDTSIIPQEHIIVVLPLDTDDVLWLASVLVQRIEKLLRFLRTHAFDVVRVGRDVQVHPSRGFVSLDQFVAAHEVVVRIYAWERFW